jgi:hypothetical protein
MTQSWVPLWNEGDKKMKTIAIACIVLCVIASVAVVSAQNSTVAHPVDRPTVAHPVKIEVPARQFGAENILAEWPFDPNHLRSGVNSRPLSIGWWEDQYWSEAQTARCSNNRYIQVPTGGANAIRWVVESTTQDPNTITFNVSIDLPGADPVAWPNQGNNSVVSIEPLPEGLTLREANARGFYIASVRGANGPFTVKAVAASR